MKNATRQDIERACQIVYEDYTGKCWHVRASTCDDNWLGKTCKKCQIVNPDINPPLATSLDAWAEHIWTAMDSGKKYQHTLALKDLCNEMRIEFTYSWAHTPIHHLEAALRACGKYDEWAALNNA